MYNTYTIFENYALWLSVENVFVMYITAMLTCKALLTTILAKLLAFLVPLPVSKAIVFVIMSAIKRLVKILTGLVAVSIFCVKAV